MEILKEKIIKKNAQYGNSITEPALILNDNDDIEMLASIRADDKLARMKTLDKNSDKYDSELKELVAYIMWILYIRGWKKRKLLTTKDI